MGIAFGILIAAYVFVGAVIAAVYTPLASGALTCFIVTAWVSPAAVLLLWFLWGIATEPAPALEPITQEPYHPPHRFLPLSLVSAFFLLPIIFRMISVLAEMVGNEEFARVAFEYRFWSLLIASGAIIVVFFLWGFVVRPLLFGDRSPRLSPS